MREGLKQEADQPYPDFPGPWNRRESMFCFRFARRDLLLQVRTCETTSLRFPFYAAVA
jgi:hypothetical protein